MFYLNGVIHPFVNITFNIIKEYEKVFFIELEACSEQYSFLLIFISYITILYYTILFLIIFFNNSATSKFCNSKKTRFSLL